MRYCGDQLLGFTGPRTEAEEIKQRLAAFLRDDLKLELSRDVTRPKPARLGVGTPLPSRAEFVSAVEGDVEVVLVEPVGEGE